MLSLPKFGGVLGWLVLCACCLLTKTHGEDYSASTAEGALRLQAFRNFRYKRDYRFDFTLTHTEPKGAEKQFKGTLEGSWNDQGPSYTLIIHAGPQTQKLELFIQAGPISNIYQKEPGSGQLQSLPQTLWNKPLIQGTLITPFDLAMPFIYWDTYTYDGRKKVIGRNAFEFYFYIPEPLKTIYPQLGGIRLSMDESYNALLKVEYLNLLGQTLRSLQLRSFKKVQGEYFVKTFDIIDSRTQAKTRFTVQNVCILP